MSGTNLPNETVSEFKERLKATLDDAKFAYELAKADQSARSSFKCKPHSYEPGDKSWINKNYLTIHTQNLRSLINCL